MDTDTDTTATTAADTVIDTDTVSPPRYHAIIAGLSPVRGWKIIKIPLSCSANLQCEFLLRSANGMKNCSGIPRLTQRVEQIRTVAMKL